MESSDRPAAGRHHWKWLIWVAVPAVVVAVIFALANPSDDSGENPSETVPAATGVGAEPLRVSVSVDSESASSLMVDSDGGSVEVDLGGGFAATMTVPPGAVSEGLEVTVSPVTGSDGLPVSGGLVAGVDLSPAGLELLQPVEVAVTVPEGVDAGSLVGFGYNGDEAYLTVTQVEQGAVRFRVAHFSGVLLGSGDLDTDALGTPTSVEDMVTQQITMIMSEATRRWQEAGAEPNVDILEGEYGKITQILTDWYQREILGPLVNAETANEIERALGRFLRWRIVVQLFNLESGLSELVNQARAQLVTQVASLQSQWSASCADARDLEEKRALVDETLEVERMLASEVVESHVDLKAFCDGILNEADPSFRIVLEPVEATILVDEDIDVEASILDRDGESLTGALDWSTDGDAAVLVVGVNDSVNVYGDHQGTDNVMASSRSFRDITATAQITVGEVAAHFLVVQSSLRDGDLVRDTSGPNTGWSKCPWEGGDFYPITYRLALPYDATDVAVFVRGTWDVRMWMEGPGEWLDLSANQLVTQIGAQVPWPPSAAETVGDLVVADVSVEVWGGPPFEVAWCWYDEGFMPTSTRRMHEPYDRRPPYQWASLRTSVTYGMDGKYCRTSWTSTEAGSEAQLESCA